MRKNRITAGTLLNARRARLTTRLFGLRYAARVKRRVSLAPAVLAAVAAGLLVPLVIMNALRIDAGRAEWWSRTVARAYERAVGALTSWLPISVYELFVVILIAAGLFLFGRFVINLCRGAFMRIVTGVLAVAVGAAYVGNAYMLSMGFGYYRRKMPLPQAGADYRVEKVIEVAEYFLNDYNALAQKLPRDENGCVINPYGFDGTARRIAAEYAKLDDGYFSPYTPNAKQVVNSWLMSDMLITGVTFLPTGEASLNVVAPPSVVTFTTAHELAHTKGVQREGDANLIAQYVMLSSEDEYLRYCGYYNAFGAVMSAIVLAMGDELQYATEYNRLVGEMTPLISVEKLYANKYWSSQPDIIGKLSEFFNDLYLKFNGASNGTGSYGDGNHTDAIRPTDPSTGEPITDPDTGKPGYIPVYSTLQKVFFYLYEQKSAR